MTSTRRPVLVVALPRVLVLLACLLPDAARGHDSPEHVVDHLTARMAREGRSAELLYRRAGEYRVLGRLEAAADDLEQAIRLDPSYRPAFAELGRVLLAQGRSAEAMAAVDRAIARIHDEGDQAPLRMIRCEILLADGLREQALAECQWACDRRPGEVDWSLIRSQIQAQLGRHDDRIRDLIDGFERSQSVVLKIEWIEALIDAGRERDALGPIEAELADSRWRSSWLLRRARALRGLGRHRDAEADLRAAVAEINQRLHPAHPDPSLVADRGLALGLLGDRPAARRDLDAARALRADPWMVSRLESLLAAPDPAGS